MKTSLIITLLLYVLGSVSISSAQEIFTVNGPEGKTDKRHLYVKSVMALALEKTKKEYGDYQLRVNLNKVNLKRSLELAKEKKYPNFFIRQSVSLDLMEEMAYVPFPIERGIVGYRVAFVSSKTHKKLQKINSLEQLMRLEVVQGIQWLDTRILRGFGFSVYEAPSYEGMFHMVANNRLPLFLRGVNEVYDEWQSHKHISNLMLDDTFALYYPLPRFLFTAKENGSAVKRIHAGLLKAYEDGSFVKLWREHYAKSIAFTNFKNRKLYRLDNPLIGDVGHKYQKYMYDPTLEQQD